MTLPLLSLKFIVVGGSIAGLSSAYALRKSGHEVVVLDETDGKTKGGGSIRSPPNMTRILQEWPGMEALFESCATKCSGISFRSAGTSEPVGLVKIHEEIMSELGADFLVLQHDDLRRGLASICLAAGVVVRYGSKAVGVKSSEGSATVALENGQILHGDIVVGADGHNSILRSIVAEEHLEATHTVAGINITIPPKAVEEDEDLKSLCKYNELTIWMGNGSSLIGTLDKDAEIFNLALCFPPATDLLDSGWYASCTVKDIVPSDLLAGYDPRLQKLIQLGHHCCRTIHRVFEQDEIVGLDGTAVLVGDAAHSALLNGSHNSSMAVEDAATLGRLFSKLAHRRQIPLLLDAYREIRHPRTSATQEAEYQSFIEISLPSGSLQETRDVALKATLSKAFEDFDNCEASEVLVQTWEQYLVLFNHDASEEVDNWWSMWGSAVEAAVQDRS